MSGPVEAFIFVVSRLLQHSYEKQFKAKRFLCQWKKKKKKEQTPGTMALPAVVAPFTCLLSAVFGPNPVPVCTLRLSVGQITSEVGQDQ